LDVQSGKLCVNGEKFLLINAAALGTLRRDLVSTLGRERAKGFLHRYGWSCGYQDAKLMSKQFPDETDENLLLLGPKMHQLEGIGQVIIEKIRVDQHKKKFYMEGIWLNSYESEQHINHFSLSEEPVCWTLIGYAGGFSTGVFAKRILFKEIKCVGRGDDECRFVGKTLDEWGEDISSELSYYSESKIAEELEDAHQHIQNQHKLLLKIMNIHEKLNRMVLAGHSRHEIIESLGKTLNSPIIVEDRYFKPLVWWAPHNIDFEVSKYSLGTFRDKSPELCKLLRGVEKEKRTIHLFLKEDTSFLERTTAPIVLGEEIVGYLSVIHVAGVEKELRLMTTEGAALVIALDFSKELTARETEHSLRGEFIEELLTDTTPLEALKKRAGYMGYNFDYPHRFILVNINSSNRPRQDCENRDILKAIRRELSDIVQNMANSKGDILVVDRREDIVVLANTGDNGFNPMELINILQRRMSKIFETTSVYICVSREAESIVQIRSVYSECSDTIQVLSRLGRQGGVFFVDDMSLFDLLYASPEQNKLLQYAKQSLEKLINYEKSTGTMNLLKTLYVFLANECNLKHTSKELNVSLSGLKYRLQRLREIGELNLEDSNERFNIQLALRVLLVNGSISLI